MINKRSKKFNHENSNKNKTDNYWIFSFNSK